MATSFAVPDAGIVSQQPAPAPAGPQITLQGGGGGRAPQAPGGQFAQAADMSMKAMDALNQMTQGALAPYVAAQQQQAYLAGATQVAFGRALQDIEREQPWYTQIFGPSATVQGAQAMSAMTALSQAQADFTAQLPELRKQPPGAVHQYLAEQAASIANTGDAAVDGLIQQKLMDEWPTLLSTYMKQHVAWQQQDAASKFIEMQTANGALLQQTLAQQQGFSDSPEERAREVAKFTDGLAQPAGMTDEAYGTVMTASAQAHLHGGNFAAYEAMKALPEVWQAIPQQARQQLLDSEEKWKQVHLTHAAPLVGITTDEAKFKLAVSQGRFENEAQIHATIDRFNERFRAETGAAGNMMDNAERAALVAAHLKAQAANAAAYAQDHLQKSDDLAQRTSVRRAFNGGAPHWLSPGVSEVNWRGEMEQIWGEVLAPGEQGLDNGIAKLVLVAHEPRLRVPSLQSMLRQDTQAMLVSGGRLTERQQKSLALMQKMLGNPGGAAALQAYVGADMAEQVQAFIGYAPDLQDDKAVDAARQLVREGAGAHVSEGDVKTAQRHIAQQGRGWLAKNWKPWNWMGEAGHLREMELTAPAQAWLAQTLAPQVARRQKARPGLTPDQAAQDALSLLLDGADFADGAIAPRNPGLQGAQSLYDGVRQLMASPISQGDVRYQQAVREGLREDLTAAVTRAAHRANGGDGVSIGSPHQARAARWQADKYLAVSGEQQGGVLAVQYRHEDTGHTIQAYITPEQVVRRIQENLTRPAPAAFPLADRPGSIKAF